MLHTSTHTMGSVSLTDIKECFRKPLLGAFKQAMHLQPNFTDALMQLGYIYRETEQFTEAVEAFTIVTKIQPKNAKAYHELGVCHTKQGAYSEAVAAFERSLQLNPEVVETENLLRVAQARLARLK